MSHPLKVPGARICVIRYPDETTVCANIAGFRALGEWIAWLAASEPSKHYHFHVLWHLESEASRFDGVLPKNVWVLSQSEQLAVPKAAALGGETPPFELTFQVVTDSTSWPSIKLLVQSRHAFKNVRLRLSQSAANYSLKRTAAELLR